MQSVFEDLFIGGAADELSALQAIALFNEFRELTPAGDEGDDMIRKLAERLVSVDLLEQAAALLIHQVEFRVDGETKAEVGANLAVIRLLDRRPEAALEALDFSARRLIGLRIPEDQLVVAGGTKFYCDEKEAGVVTSVAGLEGVETVALGYVKTRIADIGDSVRLGAVDGPTVTLHAFPIQD